MLVRFVKCVRTHAARQRVLLCSDRVVALAESAISLTLFGFFMLRLGAVFFGFLPATPFFAFTLAGSAASCKERAAELDARKGSNGALAMGPREISAHAI